MNSERLAHLLVTGLGAGYLPWIPGTWGSLEAVLWALLVHWLVPAQERLVLGVLVAALTIPSVLLARVIAGRDQQEDPAHIVLDEMLGQWLCLLWVPLSGMTLFLGFLLFRFFDIVKPFPARQSERLKAGIGIVCDDLIAGIYAGLVLKTGWLLASWNLS